MTNIRTETWKIQPQKRKSKREGPNIDRKRDSTKRRRSFILLINVGSKAVQFSRYAVVQQICSSSVDMQWFSRYAVVQQICSSSVDMQQFSRYAVVQQICTDMSAHRIPLLFFTNSSGDFYSSNVSPFSFLFTSR